MLHDIPIYFMAQWCSDQGSTGQDTMPQILPRTYSRNITRRKCRTASRFLMATSDWLNSGKYKKDNPCRPHQSRHRQLYLWWILAKLPLSPVARWAGDFGVLVNPLGLFITAHVMHVVWPSAIILLLPWQGLSKTLSGWAFGVKEHPYECQYPGFPSRTSHCKMITVIQGFNVAERRMSTQEVEPKLRLFSSAFSPFSSACLWFLHMSASNRDVLNKSQLVHKRMWLVPALDDESKLAV